MKKFQTVGLFVFALLFLISCESNKKQLTNSQDYNQYLNIKKNPSVDFAIDEIDFWQKKYNKDTTQISYLNIIASKYATLFQYTGHVSDLYQSEQLLLQYNKATKFTKVGSLRSLARNYISQHRFKEALVLANKALAIGEGKKESQKLLFDVQMELGNYKQAQQNLIQINDSNDFDYLIRLAKWNDHIGDLETAITFMEKARAIAEKEDNKMLKIWSYSNLGDFYGHAGRIEDSYKSYLQTLAVDPNYSYALKGIAWIVFSHEKNTTEAKKIITAIEKQHNTPDFYLLKAQIASFERNDIEVAYNHKAYFKMLATHNYGAMYNKYNVLIYADANDTAKKALEIAEIEVNHRPTPDSYDLLAWSYLQNGNAKKALEIVTAKVVGKSFEPKVQYHLAMIFKANNLLNKSMDIKNDLKESIFELGPDYVSKINQL